MLVRIVHVLLVLVEADHLVEDLLRDGVDRRQLERGDGHLHIGEASDDRLDLGVVDAVQRLDHHQVVLLLLVFHDCRLHRREMFLVGEIDVVEERALAWQECTGQVKRLRVPEFGLTLLGRRVKRLVFLHLDYESNLGRVTEVGDGQATDFLDEGFTGEFEFILPLLYQVLNLVRLQLHDATYA